MSSAEATNTLAKPSSRRRKASILVSDNLLPQYLSLFRTLRGTTLTRNAGSSCSCLGMDGTGEGRFFKRCDRATVRLRKTFQRLHCLHLFWVIFGMFWESFALFCLHKTLQQKCLSRKKILLESLGEGSQQGHQIL